MSKFRPIHAVLLASAVASGSAMALAGEVAVQTVPNMYVYCQYRVAAIFPSEPMIRDFTYTNGTWMVPARQFYVERGMDRYSVTIADFSKGGPAVDDNVVENAAIALRQRGEVVIQFPEDYTPGIPGRQLNISQPDGRRLLSSIYMADHRLYIAESSAPPSDFAAIQLEQSMLVIDAMGRDLNGVANINRYSCQR